MNEVCFSIVNHAAWAPGVTTPQAWAQWAQTPSIIHSGTGPTVSQMPPMLRRRTGLISKMALEVAYQCLETRSTIPTLFCSRHGEVVRAIELLSDLVQDEPLSPTGFGLAVHNASAGLFSIARNDTANHIALSAGDSTVEHGVIEACGLLADGAPQVLLVVYDHPLPAVLTAFEDCIEQPYAWAWLIAPATPATEQDAIHLRWSAHPETQATVPETMPAGLQILRFQLGHHSSLERTAGPRCWHWYRNVQ